MFNEMNKKKTIKDGINLENMEFKKLKEFCGQEIHVDGYFFTKGDFGKQLVVVGNGYKINFPSRAVEIFEEINLNKEQVDAILNGKLKISNIKESKTKKGTTTLFELVDC